MNERPALLIANENSRRGGEIGPFVEALEAGGIRIRREACNQGGRLADLIRSLKDEVSSVILGGGDGTMHQAASGLHDSGLPLGILPLGTANDLARSLGIPDDAENAAQVILAGRTREIDLGTVNGIPFFNVASMGLSVDVTKRLNRIMKRRFGILAYPIAAAAAVARKGRFRASIRADGEAVTVSTLQIAVGNGRFYGGGAVVDARAEIDDGMLNVYSLEPRARWRLLVMARAFRAGEHRQLREVRTLTCRTVSVTTARRQDITADGEIVASTPAHFAILPKAVRAFAP